MAVPGKGGNFREKVVALGEKEGVVSHNDEVQTQWDAEDAAKEKAGQRPLIEGQDPEEPIETVKDGKFLADFIRPHFYQDPETEERFCALEFTFALTPAHRGKLPKCVEDAWKYAERAHEGGAINIPMPDMSINVFLAPDEEEGELHLEEVPIKKASVLRVKKSGKGTSEKITRFSFRVVAEVVESVYTFACCQYGERMWIEMYQAQRELPEA